MPFERLNIPSKRSGWISDFSPAGLTGSLHLHAHRELELNLVQRGRGAYLIQGGRYSVSEGSLLWLFPGQPHVLVDPSPDLRMWVAVFRPRLVQKLTAHTDEDGRILRLADPGRVIVRNPNPDSCRELHNLFTRLSGVDDQDHPYFNHGLGFLLRLAWETASVARPMRPTDRIHPAVEKAVHLLRNENQEGSLVRLASQAGLSYPRLCSLFSQQIGESLSSFRNRMRLQRFQELASRHPDRTLLDLALEAGFGSYAQCHRVALQFTGSPPSGLR